jgi:hypothetical protein
MSAKDIIQGRFVFILSAIVVKLFGLVIGVVTWNFIASDFGRWCCSKAQPVSHTQQSITESRVSESAN